MQHGYEPSRIIRLTQQSRAAVDDLRRIRSNDPAAAMALQAVARLRVVIETGFIPATDAITAIDPLGTKSAPNSAALVGELEYNEWLLRIIATRYEGMSDDQLFAELNRLEDALPYDDRLAPVMDDPFWKKFEQLAIEMAARAEGDDEFASRLARKAGSSVVIPLALDFARFEPELVAEMLANVAYSRQTFIDVEYNYQAYGIDLMLEFLTGFPHLALDVLANSPTDRGESLLGELLTWPVIDQAIVATFIDAAMTAPFHDSDPDLLEVAGSVLEDLVELTNRKDGFPSGFSRVTSPTLAKILIQYLPFIVTSLDGRGNVFLKDFELRDIGIKLGSYEEILDLFGAVMRDPLSMDILLAAIPVLTAIGIESKPGVEINLDDVANYLDFLKDAAANEQLEEQLEATRNRAQSKIFVDLVLGAIGAITQATGPVIYAGVDIPVELVKQGALLLIDWATKATDLGLDDVERAAFLLMVYGVAVAILQTRRDDDDEETEQIEGIVERIDGALSGGASLNDIEGLVSDLARELDVLGGDAAKVLQDERVLPDEHVVDESTTDTEK